MTILFAIKKWNAYLISSHFMIKNDHFNLKFLLNQKTNTPAQQAWVITMMRYDYEVIFKKGVSNVVADILSRILGVELKVVSIINSDLM